MKHEDLFNQWTKDSEISKDLAEEARRTARLHAKYLPLYFEEKSRLEQRNHELADLRKHLWLFYSGLCTKEELAMLKRPQFELKVLKTDLDTFIDSDDLMKTAKLRVAYTKELVEALKSIMSHINNRSYLLSNINETRRFEAGG